MLTGKKTYALAIALVLFAVFGFWRDWLDFPWALVLAGLGGLAVTLRHALTTENDKLCRNLREGGGGQALHHTVSGQATPSHHMVHGQVERR